MLFRIEIRTAVADRQPAIDFLPGCHLKPTANEFHCRFNGVTHLRKQGWVFGRFSRQRHHMAAVGFALNRVRILVRTEPVVSLVFCASDDNVKGFVECHSVIVFVQVWPGAPNMTWAQQTKAQSPDIDQLNADGGHVGVIRPVVSLQAAADEVV